MDNIDCNKTMPARFPVFKRKEKSDKLTIYQMQTGGGFQRRRKKIIEKNLFGIDSVIIV